MLNFAQRKPGTKELKRIPKVLFSYQNDCLMLKNKDFNPIYLFN
jgi:hypothetical protein